MKLVRILYKRLDENGKVTYFWRKATPSFYINLGKRTTEKDEQCKDGKRD